MNDKEYLKNESFEDRQASKDFFAGFSGKTVNPFKIENDNENEEQQNDNS